MAIRNHSVFELKSITNRNMSNFSFRLMAMAIGILTSTAIGISSAVAGALPSLKQSSTSSDVKTDFPLQPISFKTNLNDSIPQPGIIAQAAPNKKEPIGIGVTARVSTLGLGLDVSKSFSSQFDARLGFNFGSLKSTRTDSGITYDANLNLSSFQLMGDYYPFGGGFRVTGGLLSQSNRFAVTSKPDGSGNYNIDGNQIPVDQVGTLTGEFKYANSIAPYLGIGFGRPSTEGFGFNADLGVMFTGSPKVTLNPSQEVADPAIRAQVRTAINNQARTTENELKGFNVYPVLSIGVSYGF